MATYRPTIGLEIHAELKTATKMFCACKNDPDEKRPNSNVCPICLAHPGTLPVMNREAVRQVLRVGAALGSKLADVTEFDRKSYFYPDIPKGYQISQYEHPLVSGGELAGVAITRVHLEEDTARSTHTKGKSLVDFNRAGVPLMELVTEPVIHDAETAATFARELQLLLRTLGAGDANLEKGEMRIEANISISEQKTVDSKQLGTKVEVKNLNSFRSVERAIAFEIARQTNALEKGERLIQETRGWDEGKSVTFHQRTKEGSADYRYFPEPDLPPLTLSEVVDLRLEALETTLPELPWERRARYSALGALKDPDIIFITATSERSDFIDAVIAECKGDAKLITLAVNYFVSDLAGEVGPLSPTNFAQLMRMIATSELSSRGGKDVLAVMKASGGEPGQIATEKGLLQMHNTEALARAVQKVIEANPKVAADYREGKQAALQYLLGQVMRETKGAGNPVALRELLLATLSK